jgi:hypothetical protein
MNKEELKKLNFSELLKIDHPNIEQYSFDDYKKNGNRHLKITKMCTLCEKEGVNICTSDKNYRLKTMGHGSMTDDFLVATGQKKKIDLSDWKDENVLFLLENPGPCDPKIYTPFEYKKDSSKYPTHQWYFLNHTDDPQKCEYPNFFHGKEYGGFFTSVLFTFKLKNMYITDLIKCGMNDDSENNFKHIHDYKPECIKNCLEHYFYEEIKLVNPKIIFCLGDITYNKIKKIEDEIKKRVKHDSIVIKELPHPRRHLSAIEFQNEYYRGIIAGLRKSDIITEQEKNDLIKRGKIKILEEIRQFLEKKGFTINEPHNNYIGSKKINGISFYIQNNENGLSFHWGNGGDKKLNYEWFKRKNNEISKIFPNSTVNIGEKKQEWIRLFIPIPTPKPTNQYEKSIFKMINETKEIMEYQ